jgi:transcriptional regulator with XRE-family HTH domain
MLDDLDPVVQQLALRMRLRRLRIHAGLTQKAAASTLGWPVTKLLKIEGGETGIGHRDLQALLHHYQVGDRHQRDELVRMAKRSRQPTKDPDDGVSREVQMLSRYERSTSIIRQFEISVVPGLLQTEEYATAILKQFARPNDSARTIQRRVAARMRRQTLLDRRDPPEMFFILDEAVVRRWVGAEGGAGLRVMRRQLEYLKVMSDRPRITVQILPFTIGAHPGMKGPFVILEFADPDIGELLYLEDAKGDYISREDPAVIRPYLEAFWELEAAAADDGDLDGMLDQIIAQLPS